MKVQSHVGTLVVEDVRLVEQPMKVCMHVLERARTDERVLREARTLVEQGFVVSIIDIESERNCPVEEDIRGIRVRHVIMPGWFNYSWHFDPLFLIRALFMLWRCALQLIRTPADIFHAHDAKALPATFVAARLHRKPLIFDAHELPVTEITARWHGLTKVSRYLIGRIVPHCAGVITVSQPIASEISKHYRYPKVSLIRNVPAYKCVPRSDRLRQHLGLGPDALIALYQGHLQPDRQLDRLVYAAKFLGEGRVIVLMGKSVGPTAHQLEALARKEGVDDRLKILPPVPYEELLEWTASADIGLIIYSPDQSLNVKFCLPNKLFEYLMAGLPVLSTHLDAVADMLSTYEVGRVAFSLRPDDIGAAINRMLVDRTALASMHSKALEVVQHDLCWETESEELVRLYREVLGMQHTRILSSLSH